MKVCKDLLLAAGDEIKFNEKKLKLEVAKVKSSEGSWESVYALCDVVMSKKGKKPIQIFVETGRNDIDKTLLERSDFFEQISKFFRGKGYKFRERGYGDMYAVEYATHDRLGTIVVQPEDERKFEEWVTDKYGWTNVAKIEKGVTPALEKVVRGLADDFDTYDMKLDEFVDAFEEYNKIKNATPAKIAKLKEVIKQVKDKKALAKIAKAAELLKSVKFGTTTEIKKAAKSFEQACYLITDALDEIKYEK